MNGYLLQLIERYVTAYENEQQRKQEEWELVRDEAKRRTVAMEKLAKLGMNVTDDMEIVDLGEFLGEEDGDENRGD